MSVKIKVSYTTDKELAGLLRLLSPVLGSKKVSKNREGKYRKAYIGVEGERLAMIGMVTQRSKK